jgi:nucleoside-diphosphate-sugar epimerase
VRVIVIGATGHIGSYLVPKLVNQGFEVIAISRNKQTPYNENPAWLSVKSVILDRQELEKSDQFGKAIAKLNPDIVIDLICFTKASAQQLLEAVKGKIKHFLHCGTIWVHGETRAVPTLEEQTKFPLSEYGKDKAEIEQYLHDEFMYQQFPATIIHPGHIVGPGWTPLNPAGNFNEQIFIDISQGKEVILPNLGLETLHHVHADDVASLFIQAIKHRKNALGESFHAVSEQALTLKGYALYLSDWYAQPADLRYLPINEMKHYLNEQDFNATVEHVSHSTNCSNVKAKKLLEFKPKYSSIEAIQESLLEII